jgi:hypothetical protein
MSYNTTVYIDNGGLLKQVCVQLSDVSFNCIMAPAC